MYLIKLGFADGVTSKLKTASIYAGSVKEAKEKLLETLPRASYSSGWGITILEIEEIIL